MLDSVLLEEDVDVSRVALQLLQEGGGGEGGAEFANHGILDIEQILRFLLATKLEYFFKRENLLVHF